MPKTIFLVSCVKTKLNRPAEARDLYISPWFKKARAYVELRMKPGDKWFILSALHCLVTPEQVLAPYEKRLSQNSSKGESERWAGAVWDKLRPIIDNGDRVVILAGQAYRRTIIDRIRMCGAYVEIPMDGLQFGPQLEWLGRQLDGH
jgi:hypothetical protein